MHPFTLSRISDSSGAIVAHARGPQVRIHCGWYERDSHPAKHLSFELFATLPSVLFVPLEFERSQRLTSCAVS